MLAYHAAHSAQVKKAPTFKSLAKSLFEVVGLRRRLLILQKPDHSWNPPTDIHVKPNENKAYLLEKLAFILRCEL